MDNKENSKPMPKNQKVISGSAKKSEKGKIIRAIFSNDDVVDLKHHLVYEVLIPTVKRAASESLTKAVNAIFGTHVSVPRDSISGRTDYHGASDRRESTSRVRSVLDYDDIIVGSYEEADTVIQKMLDQLEEFHMVRISDLYELVGLTAPYTGNSYGWRNLDGARPVAVSEGEWLIKLPKAVFLR